MVKQLKRFIKNNFSEQIEELIFFRNRILCIPYPNIEISDLLKKIVMKTSGISSVSQVTVTTSDLNDIKSTSIKLADSLMKDNISFAIRTNREGNHPYTSMDVSKFIGSEIINNFQTNNLKVNLTNPDVTIYIDIREKLSFIYSDIIKGMDGLPHATQGTALALIKPHINSLLSAWLMKKRGVKIVPIYFMTDHPKNDQFLSIIENIFGLVPIIVNLRNFLDSNKEESHLCFKCQAFCESLCKKYAHNNKISNLISQTTLNYNDEKINLEGIIALQNLEEDSFFIFRPLLLGFSGKLPDFSRFSTRSCCSYTDKVDLCLNPKEKFTFKAYSDLELKNFLIFPS